MKLKFALILALALALPRGPLHAGAVVGATEPTQILNNLQLGAQYVEQVQQTLTQINQYKAMLENLKQLTPSSLLDQAARKLWCDFARLWRFALDDRFCDEVSAIRGWHGREIYDFVFGCWRWPNHRGGFDD